MRQPLHVVSGVDGLLLTVVGETFLQRHKVMMPVFAVAVLIFPHAKVTAEQSGPLSGLPRPGHQKNRCPVSRRARCSMLQRRNVSDYQAIISQARHHQSGR